MPHPERMICWTLCAWFCSASARPAFGVDDFAFFHENVMGTSLELRVLADDRESARGAEDRVLGEIDRLALIFSEVKERAVSTSGSSQRGFRINGQWYSHILDPRSGLPADRIATGLAWSIWGVPGGSSNAAPDRNAGLAIGSNPQHRDSPRADVSYLAHHGPMKRNSTMPILRQVAQLGHPVLRTLAAPVERPTSVEVRALIDDMLATLREADGVGIAAPQVYEPVALFIVASRPNPCYPEASRMEPEVVINPEILERSEDMIKGWEGCLSIPGIRGEVRRHRRIRTRYQTAGGQQIECEFTGFVARIFQHEEDHLRGIVFLDRLESTRDLVTEREYQKLLKG